MLFSIIVVNLNAGDKLRATVQSIVNQSFKDFEIVVKDGGSKDDSIKLLNEYIENNEEAKRSVKLFVLKDRSIYDGMNEAIDKAEGDYILFLNCGDYFYDTRVLEKTADYIKKNMGEAKLFYGDTFSQKTGETIYAAPQITGFTCYRNIPCHQSCFYHRSLFETKKYNCDFKIRADYDHFLWCYYKGEANPQNMHITISVYEGGGYSESPENKKRDSIEHKEITGIYMSRGEIFKYKTLLLLSLAPLRTLMADSAFFSGFYNKIKKLVYKR